MFGFVLITLSITISYIHYPELSFLYLLWATTTTKINKKWLNWFEILKFISVIIGCFSLYFYPEYKENILKINILEAILYDKSLYNKVSGVLLLYYCEYEQIFWILLYSTWNAAFSYGRNFNWTTRFILLIPLILYFMHQDWLYTRCYSLLLNMILRSTEIIKYYDPKGKTFLTVDTPQHNEEKYKIWCTLNLVCTILYTINTI